MPSQAPRRSLDLVSWTRRPALWHFLPLLPFLLFPELAASTPGKRRTRSGCLRVPVLSRCHGEQAEAGTGQRTERGRPWPEAASPPGAHVGPGPREGPPDPRGPSQTLQLRTECRRGSPGPLLLMRRGVRFVSRDWSETGRAAGPSPWSLAPPGAPAPRARRRPLKKQVGLGQRPGGQSPLQTPRHRVPPRLAAVGRPQLSPSEAGNVRKLPPPAPCPVFAAVIVPVEPRL